VELGPVPDPFRLYFFSGDLREVYRLRIPGPYAPLIFVRYPSMRSLTFYLKAASPSERGNMGNE